MCNFLTNGPTILKLIALVFIYDILICMHLEQKQC